MVPEISVLPPAISMSYVPLRVRLLRDTVPPLFWANRPDPLVLRTPPVMLTPFCSATVEPFAALIVPDPVCVQVPPCICRVPPFVASSVPVLVLPTLPVGSRLRMPALRLAFIMHLLATE